MEGQFLSVDSISAAYNKALVIDDISFNLNEGELACLLGPSGCGKTTILRAISGFQNIESGNISLDKNIIATKSINVLPEKRNVGMVFQEHALFPHLTLAKNISFGLHKLSKNEQKKKTRLMLDLIGMSDFGERYPHELSGGQAQRVALARAIAPQPKLLLLDEPFSNLDTELRESLGYEIRNLLKELGITSIMVTHDQHDAFALGDKVGVMSQGKLLQWDTSFNLYHAPNSRFVANFIGDGVFVKGTLIKEDTVSTKFGEIKGEKVGALINGNEIDLLIRPDDVSVNANSNIRGRIIRKAFKGAQTLYTLKLETGEQLMSLMPSHDDYEINEVIGVTINPDHLVCFSN